MAWSTLTAAKAVSILAYEPFVREKADTRTWPWEEIFQVGTTNKAEARFVKYAGVPSAQYRTEGTAVPYYDPTELASFTLTHIKLLLGTRITYELIEDNLHIKGLMSDLGTMHGESHGQAVDLYVSLGYNRAFNSTYKVDPVDSGSELCGTHNLLDGNTYTNLIDPAAPDTDTLLSEIATYQFRRKNHVGLYAKDMVDSLLCAPEKFQNWRRILSNSVEPDTMDRNDNFVKGYGLKLHVNPHLTTTTNWFLHGKRWKKDAVVLWKKRTKVDEPWDDKDFRAIKIPSETRVGFVLQDYLGIRGCVGI